MFLRNRKRSTKEMGTVVFLARYENSIADEKGHAATTPTGAMVFETTSPLEGVASLKPQVGKSLRYANGGDFNFYGVDFCVELVVRASAKQVIGFLIGTANGYFGGGEIGGSDIHYAGGWSIRMDETQTVLLGSGNSLRTYPYSLPIGQDVSLIMCAEGSLLRFYAGGVLLGEGPRVAFANDPVNGLYVGNHKEFTDYPFRGLIDRVRITKGWHRYKGSTITPGVF